MSQMACRCGGTIRDHNYPCPTEGSVLREQDEEAWTDGACRDIVAFFAAVKDGRRNDWLGAYFTPQYPTDVSDEGVVHDILSAHLERVLLSLAECERCGRLHLQRDVGVNSYRSYAPDEPGHAGALRTPGPSATESQE